MTKLALTVLAQHQTPSHPYNTECPCKCGGRIGVETVKRDKRDGRGWVIRYLKCRVCGWTPPDGTNKWVSVE